LLVGLGSFTTFGRLYPGTVLSIPHMLPLDRVKN